MFKIVVTGPESSGKTTLAKCLSVHLGTYWVQEYAREYLEENGPNYEFSDLRAIAEGQMNNIKVMASLNSDYLICDTDLLTIVIWSTERFGFCDPWIVETWKSSLPDTYILCAPDMPWEPDPLREHPNERKRLFKVYQDFLEEEKVPFFIVEGTVNKRIENIKKNLNLKDRT